jgi:hypothetical protein
LKSGWNLIANPYNYAFPLGQLVGVSASDATHSYTWQQLASQGVVSGSLAFWDSSTQSYQYVSALADYVQPNTGYWIYVNTTQDLTLSFPAVFEPFIPAGTGGITAAQADWKMQLVATQTNTGMSDTETYLGYAKAKTIASTLIGYKPPIAPTKNAISAGIVGSASTGRAVRLSQTVTNKVGTQMWDYVVETKAAGPVRITWPNVKYLPKNVSVKMMEVGTNRTIDVRNSGSYFFNAAARSVKTFRFIVSGIGQ